MSANKEPEPMTPGYPFGTFTENGQRYAVWLEAEIKPAQLRATGRTIDHEPIPADALEVAISGTTYYATKTGARDRRYRDGASYGQVLDDLCKVAGARAQRIAALWERWHLNGLRANCAHMPNQTYTPGLVCPAGLPAGKPYTSGFAWLYEPIPADVLAEIRRYFPNAG